MQNSYRHTNGKYRFRPYLSCSSGRRFHQISLLPSINPPCSVQGRSFINFRCKLHFLESMGNLVSLPFIAESFANKKRSTHLSWEELDLNQQNPKVPDLQSGPLPITVYLPSTGMRPLATSLSCICFTLSGLQPFTGNSFIQLPRKTGRTISSHPQAFPLALSVHIQNCHKYFRENLSKVFTRTAVTIPGTFSPFGDRQGIACLPLLQQLAHACQGRFIWLIRLPPILCLQGHAGFEQFTLRAKAHSWNSRTGDTSTNYIPTTPNRE